MATPRAQLVDSTVPMHYHLVSRCVRRSWLCGRDSYTRKNFDHRKHWLRSRIFHLARCFAVGLDGFAIMSNHFHLVVFYDPEASNGWSDEEVADRWTEAFPPSAKGLGPQDLNEVKAIAKSRILNSPKLIAKARATLGSLSAFMKHLKQPIAWRANREDGASGHFFEGRFYSGALLSEEAVVAAMAYVDLNPVRAKIARTIELCRDSSIAHRLAGLANTPERLNEAIKPLVSGLSASAGRVTITLQHYISRLRTLVGPTTTLSSEQQRWAEQVAAIRSRGRAYGLADDLQQWFKRRGWKRRGQPLP
jgi:REP element-mobilizing transposase RayT